MEEYHALHDSGGLFSPTSPVAPRSLLAQLEAKRQAADPEKVAIHDIKQERRRQRAHARGTELAADVPDPWSQETPQELLVQRAQDLWEKGCEDFQSARFEEAEELFRRVCALHGDSLPPGECVEQLAEAYRRQGRDRQAETLYLQMLLWHEATQHFHAENFAAANTLFTYGQYFASVAEAKAFLQEVAANPVAHKADACCCLLCGDASVALLAVEALLALLGSKGEAIDAIVAAGGVELLHTACHTHKEPDLVAACFSALRLLLPPDHSDRARMVFWLRQHHAVAWTVNRLKMDSSAVQKSGLAFLASLALGDLDVKRELIALDVVPAAVRMLATDGWAGGLLFLETVLAAPAWMEDFVKPRHDALTLSLAMFQQHLDRSHVCVAALKIFRQFGRLSAPEPSDVSAGVQVTLTALQKHSSLKVASVGMDVLVYFTEFPAGAEEVALSPGVVAAAMDSHSSKAEVVAPAIGVVKNIASLESDRRLTVLRVGFIPRMVAALRRFPGNVTIANEVLGALLRALPAAPQTLTRIRGLDVVVETLQQLTDEPTLLLGVQLLGLYTATAELKKELHVAGAAQLTLPPGEAATKFAALEIPGRP